MPDEQGCRRSVAPRCWRRSLVAFSRSGFPVRQRRDPATDDPSDEDAFQDSRSATKQHRNDRANCCDSENLRERFADRCCEQRKPHQSSNERVALPFRFTHLFLLLTSKLTGSPLFGRPVERFVMQCLGFFLLNSYLSPSESL